MERKNKTRSRGHNIVTAWVANSTVASSAFGQDTNAPAADPMAAFKTDKGLISLTKAAPEMTKVTEGLTLGYGAWTPNTAPGDYGGNWNDFGVAMIPHFTYHAFHHAGMIQVIGAYTSKNAVDVGNHLINFNEYPFPGSFWPVTPEEKLTNLHRWGDVIAALKKWHGEKAKVVVFPDATIQMFPKSETPRHPAETAAH